MQATTTLPEVSPALADIAAGAAQQGDLKSERIAAAFERKILSGELAPGAKLPTETELCELLNVSRSVIRDAVRRLVAQGLVNVRQGRGTTVAEPSGEAYSNALLVLLARSALTMGDVFAARAAIETSLVAIAARNGTPEDWEQLERTYDEFADAIERNDDLAAGTCHARFHTLLLESAHMPALTLMLRPMADLTIVSSAASVLRTISGDWELEEHLPILNALKAGDAEAATKAMVAHYETASNPVQYNEFMDRLFSDAYFS
ncbi:GntR family transcriptional activator of glc operon [Nocardioides sp. J9]|uniref:FadR/GntR family transcriptional regulator n=1 Tax=Nocardioides sp. J9 TaxID=935844 RepID=UPI0011ADEC01|nr:FadR/GntR family transcriptional regulator [Nocardioides sp. J9]TWH01735.1 GntR family transcriptional activator of glc operon [Nocardioides sp. J9]